MIDWSQVRQLQDDVGAEEMPEVIELFLLEVDEAMDDLTNTHQNLSHSELSAAFHFLKGCASNLGFQKFCELCSGAEEETKNGKNASVDLADLAQVYDGSKSMFNSEYDQQMA